MNETTKKLISMLARIQVLSQHMDEIEKDLKGILGLAVDECETEDASPIQGD